MAMEPLVSGGHICVAQAVGYTLLLEERHSIEGTCNAGNNFFGVAEEFCWLDFSVLFIVLMHIFNNV